jgi:predicted membrane protein
MGTIQIFVVIFMILVFTLACFAFVILPILYVKLYKEEKKAKEAQLILEELDRKSKEEERKYIKAEFAERQKLGLDYDCTGVTGFNGVTGCNGVTGYIGVSSYYNKKE